VFWYYHRLIRLRKTVPLVTTGRYEPLDLDHPQVFAFLRHGDGEALLVTANASSTAIDYPWPDQARAYPSRRVLIGNLDSPAEHPDYVTLRPWEAVVWHLSTEEVDA
jgi:trehalose-6-phosphate hydrolase